MFNFEAEIINSTVNKLLGGEDYRQEIVNEINIRFLDFTLEFFRKIVDAKLNDEPINLDWYKRHFLNDLNYGKEDIAVYFGINLKTVTNIYGTSSKQTVIDVANRNYDYLRDLIRQLEADSAEDLNIQIKITRNNVSVDLNLTESLLVLNALTTKKFPCAAGRGRLSERKSRSRS